MLVVFKSLSSVNQDSQEYPKNPCQVVFLSDVQLLPLPSGILPHSPFPFQLVFTKVRRHWLLGSEMHRDARNCPQLAQFAPPKTAGKHCFEMKRLSERLSRYWHHVLWRFFRLEATRILWSKKTDHPKTIQLSQCLTKRGQGSISRVRGVVQA